MKSFKLTAAIAIVAISVTASGAPGDTELVSERFSAGHASGNASSESNRPYAISDDGRYVAFESNATNLVTGDTNNREDVFVYDHQTNSVERVSIDSTGLVQGNSDSNGPSISGDGRYVAFDSAASNLVAGDTNNQYDVFVHDRQLGTTERVSVADDEAQGNGFGQFAAISDNGNFIAFQSSSTNLVAGDTNGAHDIFVRDRTAGTTERVSVDSAEAQANGFSFARPSISGDGRYVAFRSDATNLVGGDTNGVSDIFVRDRQSGTTESITFGSMGAGSFGSYGSSISKNGNFVAFHSYATDLVGSDTNNHADVFLCDRTSLPCAFERISVNSLEAQTTGSSGGGSQFGSFGPSISDDGRYVAFRSYATNLDLAVSDTNDESDVFVRDRTLGTTVRVSVDSAGGEANGAVRNPTISGDGFNVAFHSFASNLVDLDDNGTSDVFLYDLSTGIPAIASRADYSLSVNGGNGHSEIFSSGESSVSQTGRYVAFYSLASNLVAGDTNGAWDIFVRDRNAGTTERVSVDSAGAQSIGGNSFNPSISDDGRYVAFYSRASNLVAGDTNSRTDIFVRDRNASTTERVSVDSAGAQSIHDSFNPSISDDGRYVAFNSFASNLVAGDTNGRTDIFVRDRNASTTERVSVDSAGAQSIHESHNPSISDDGRYVAFYSFASNLVAGDTNGAWDIFVRDRNAGTTERVSVDSAGAQSFGGNGSFNPSISDDGRYVAFFSRAINLVAGDTNGASDIFVHDRNAGTTERVSVDSSGAQATSVSFNPSISGDGRYVAFNSNASNLVAGDTNGQTDIFVHDRQTNTTVLASIDSGGTLGDNQSVLAHISGDGSAVAFRSTASNLAPDGTPYQDIFIHELVVVANTAPVADEDSYNATEDTPLNIAAPGVLDGDTDADGDTLTATLDTDVSYGSLTLNADGSFDYTPDGDYCGADSFTYHANDGTADSNIAAVSIDVDCVDDAPLAVDDSKTVTEDDPATAIDVLLNDTDIDGGTKDIFSVTQPPNGTVLITGGGSGLTYAPDPNACNDGTPTDDFTYTLTPGSSMATVRVTVDCVDDAPLAVDDSKTVTEDDPATAIDVLLNDTDIDGGTKDIFSVTQPPNGTVLITGGGSGLTYAPDPNACNDGTPTDDFTYTLTPGSSMATVRVTVDCVDDAPLAVDDSKTVTEDDPATAIDVLLNDTDIDGGTKDIFSVTQPPNGTVLITGGGSGLTYAPDPNACNDGTPTDDFTYTLTPGSSMATVRVTVDCVDDAPLAVDDSKTVTEDDPATAIDVLLNDTDIDGGTKDIFSVTQPPNGTVLITGGGSGLTYAPDPNACNDGTPTDDFTYTLTPGSSMATVRVTVDCVDDAPLAVDDSKTVTEDDPATAIDVLLNDTDIDGGTKDIFSVTQPPNGTVLITGGGSGLTYAPDPNACNDGTPTDDFTYTLTPGSSMATVRVTVDCVDDAPLAVDDSKTVTEDDPATAIDVLLNDTDIDGGTKDIFSVTQPPNGTVLITGGGSGLTYAPDPNACNDGTPTDDFTYTLTPGSSMATVRVTVDCVDDAPLAVDDSKTVTEDDPATAIDVLLNDTDIDGGTKDIFSVTQPPNGTVLITGGGSGLTYAPDPNACNDGTPTDDFTYTLTPGSSMATVRVTVDCVDDAPLAVDDSKTVTEDDPATAIDVLLNDTDIDGGTKDIFSVTQPPNGTVLITGGGSGLTYAPDPNACNDGTPTDDFTYTLTPGSSMATVRVTVDCVDDAPLAVDDSKTVTEDDPATAIDVLLNDTDIDGGTKDIFSVTQPPNGTVLITGGGSGLTYAPDPNACNDGTPTDDFTYTLTPGSSMATVRVTVDCVNDAPDADDDNYNAIEDMPLNVAAAAGVLVDDTDVENDPLTAVLNADVSNGSLMLNADGSFTYTPNANYCGADSFTYHANDGADNSNIAMVDIVVACVNDAPVADDDDYNATEDTLLNVAAPGVLDGDSDIDGDTLTAVLNANVSNGSLTLNADGSFDYTPNDDYCGADSFTYHASDGPADSNIATVSIDVACVNDEPTVSASPDTQTLQYSDPIEPVTIAGDDIDSTNLSIVTTALPAGLSLSAASCSATVPPVDCEWTVSGNITEGPDIYAVTVTVTDNGGLTAETTFEITVEQEDARSTYTGPLFLSSEENGDFTVTLMATVRDITVVGGDPDYDPDAGDIRNATVTFVDDGLSVLGDCEDIPVTLVFAGNEQVGSASCDYSGSLGNNEEELALEVTVVIDNYYTEAEPDEVVVLIVRPGEGKITGGGQLEMDYSAGVYAADPELRTNYGFNAMAVKKGKKTQLKGRVTIILRAADGHKYKIKSNALLSLGVDLGADPNNEPFYAEFESKANLTDATDPLNPISLGGNLLLQLRMTDYGEPGENDTISFTLWDGGTLLFSSNWDGSQSVEQNVARGNLQVH